MDPRNAGRSVTTRHHQLFPGPSLIFWLISKDSQPIRKGRNMKRFFSLACLVLALQPYMASAQRQQYEIDAKILNFPKGQIRITSETMQVDGSSPTNSLVASAPSALEITIDSN